MLDIDIYMVDERIHLAEEIRGKFINLRGEARASIHDKCPEVLAGSNTADV